jgi:uncharacterized SAM-binding protein YcdF (DUF218 family)
MIHYLIDPLTILLLLLSASLLCYYVTLKKAARLILWIAVGWFFIISTPWIPEFLLNQLESQYEPLTEEQVREIEGPVHILVLGGGHSFDDRLPPNSLLSGHALKRLAEAIRIHRITEESELIFSGYSSTGRTTQAEMLARTAELMGVSASDYSTQTEPGNTWEESLEYKKRVESVYGVDSEDQPSLIIVTSASHMPRAMAMFQSRGFSPAASPADYRVKHDPERPFSMIRAFPAISNMVKVKAAFREYAAMVQFRLVFKKNDKSGNNIHK